MNATIQHGIANVLRMFYYVYADDAGVHMYNALIQYAWYMAHRLHQC